MVQKSEEVVVAGMDPKEIKPSMVGGKAYKLLELSWYARFAGFQVPRFCILPAWYCETYNLQRGGPPPVSYPPLPSAYSIPPSIATYYADFYSQHAFTLMKWAEKLDPYGRPYLRSSHILDVDSSLTFAGVNYSLRPEVIPPEQTYLSYGISQVLSAMHQPYAEWYLRRHGLQEESRSVSVILGEFVHKALAGTAHILDDVVAIDAYCAVDSNVSYQPCIGSDCFLQAPNVCFSLSSTQQTWNDVWRQGKRGERLRQALVNLVACLGNSAALEVEFAFDREDVLYITQYRTLLGTRGRSKDEYMFPLSLERCKGSSLDFPVYHFVGHIEGHVCNLLQVSRRSSELTRVLEEIDPLHDTPIWLVYDHDDNRWDGFALMWALSQYPISDHLKIILVHSEFRRRTHLFCVMKEDPMIDFVVQGCVQGIAMLPSGTVIHAESNGLRTQIYPLSLSCVPTQR